MNIAFFAWAGFKKHDFKSVSVQAVKTFSLFFHGLVISLYLIPFTKLLSVVPSLYLHLQMEWLVVVDFPDDCQKEAFSGVFLQKPEYQGMMKVITESDGPVSSRQRASLGGLDSLLYSGITLLCSFGRFMSYFTSVLD